SIRKFGDSIRITVSLDDANNGNQLWGKRFDSKLEDMFLLEEELTRTIAGTISGRIGENLISVSLHKPPKDMQSYDYLMRGKYHFEKCNNKDNFIARDLFEKCLELEPNNLEAHAYIAYTHYADLLDNWSDDRKLSKDLYRQYVEKALDLDPDNAFARGFMADFHLFFGDLEHAALHVEKAIELNPTLPDGYYLKGILLALTRRYEEAVEYAEMSLKIDPHQPYSRWFSGEIYRSAGKYDRAIELFRSMSHIPPSVHGQIAACLAGLGKFDEARAEMKLYLELARDQMPNYPETEEAWRTIWYEYLAYLYEEDSKILFDLLLKAGLCDSL
ncbi:MAG: tetratricopeptide repeat protein, partial [Gammaproteobacteria bacterium]|nr:tetratricopeptide repeat protein [Gammaproteobacteria bacterium]